MNNYRYPMHSNQQAQHFQSQARAQHPRMPNRGNVMGVRGRVPGPYDQQTRFERQDGPNNNSNVERMPAYDAPSVRHEFHGQSQMSQFGVEAGHNLHFQQFPVNPSVSTDNAPSLQASGGLQGNANNSASNFSQGDGGRDAMAPKSKGISPEERRQTTNPPTMNFFQSEILYGQINQNQMHIAHHGHGASYQQNSSINNQMGPVGQFGHPDPLTKPATQFASQAVIQGKPEQLPMPPPIPPPFPPPFVERPGQAHNSGDPLQSRPLSKVPTISQQQEEDKRWLDQWLSKRKGKASSACDSRPQLNISTAQAKIRHVLVMMARLQKNVKQLETYKHEDKSIWEPRAKEVQEMKIELQKAQSEITSESFLSDLKHRIQLRKKKRERIKRRKQETFDQRQAELVAREQLHREIDKSLETTARKLQEVKQEEDLKKEADGILSEVRKKQSESTRSLALLQGLKKLRKLRRERQERQGLRVTRPDHTERFDSELLTLEELHEKQMAVYKAEESALKVILATEQEESREKERELARRREEAKRRQEERTQEKLLFGVHREPKPDDPMYPFRQYYEAANHSLDALISIRRDWDQYLVMEGTPGGTSIPDNWVIPEQPSSDTWALALTNK